MPKRTNTFQEVVSIIHGDLAGDATREDSAMLTNRLTGQQREVDVVLRAKVAGHETVIAIEATSRRGPVTAPRGESMVGKHANPPTDELVLVSESGFTKQARALAEAENVAAITPEDISGDDSAAAIMEAFPSLKPKTVDSPITTSSNDLTESLDLASVSEDADLGVEIRIEPPFTVGGKETGLRARYLEDGVQELHQIDGFLLNAKAQVRVSEIKLTHKQLADPDVTYAYGEGSVHGLPALAVVSQGPHGQKVTIRVRGDASQGICALPPSAGPRRPVQRPVHRRR
ncbi:MAG: restriction endonuclease [Solirubrobacteraceae bacterium]